MSSVKKNLINFLTENFVINLHRTYTQLLHECLVYSKWNGFLRNDKERQRLLSGEKAFKEELTKVTYTHE